MTVIYLDNIYPFSIIFGSSFDIHNILKFRSQLYKKDISFCCLYLNIEDLEGFGDFKIVRHIIHTVKYTDDLVLLGTEKTMVQSMIDKLLKT